MDYKSLMGYGKKKNKESKPKQNKVLESIKDEFNINEGPSYEYANYMKKIEKAENIQAKEVNNLVKLLTKKGLKKEATFLAGAYMKSMGEFDKYLKTLYGKLT
tara:strand:- start:367 stop:675 length:309 start_codon:yes stop_codon:yes gene_type:complete